ILCGLLLGPCAEGQNLRAQGRVGLTLWRGPERVDQVTSWYQRRLILTSALPRSQQTNIVGTTLEDRMPWSTAGDRLDSIKRGWNVVVGQLALQSQGRSGYNDPLARMADQPQQCRSQITE